MSLLLFALLSAVAGAGSLPSVPPGTDITYASNPDLIARYDFETSNTECRNGCSFGTIVRDVSGNGRDLVAHHSVSGISLLMRLSD